MDSDLSTMLGNLILVFGVGILGIWKAIPVGLLLKMHPLLIIICTSIGASLGIFIIFIIGTNIKKYLLKLMKQSTLEKRESKISRLFNKYGIHGLGIIGTLVMGPNMTMALGLAVVNKPRILLLWTNLGIILWTAVLTYLGELGILIF